MPGRFRRIAIVALVAALVLSACGGGSKGPDLSATVDKVGNTEPSSLAQTGLTGEGIDAVWRSAGSPVETADAIAAIERPDERADDAAGSIFLLYRSGTLWVSPTETGSAVALYKDNDQAYNRHGTFLFLSRGWGSRLGTYSGGGSGSGNGFRGGGSSSGK